MKYECRWGNLTGIKCPRIRLEKYNKCDITVWKEISWLINIQWRIVLDRVDKIHMAYKAGNSWTT